MKLQMVLFYLALVVGLFFLHRSLNQDKQYLSGVPAAATPGSGAVRDRFTVGFLPVTCHLTCPVTSWITEHNDTGTVFETLKFTDFPSMKEAFMARKVDATFINMPLAMKLAHDGVPVKIVYLGHRDGSAIIVPVNSPMKEFADLKGKRVAIPGRFSNQHILMYRMMKKNGMQPGDIELKELPPPEHPSALAGGAIDAYIIGEPHAAKAEMDGFGRVLYQCGDLWPGFISCGLAVRQELIDQRPDLVEELVRGIAASGKWLDSDKDSGAQHRTDASIVVGKIFYNQKPELLQWVLTRDVNRVSYSGLTPPKENFDEMMDLSVEMGLMPKRMEFDEYCDTRFAPDLEHVPLPCERLPDVDKVAAQ